MSPKTATSDLDSAPKPRRSRFGCVRCRERRSKCDEGKPACQRCLEAGVSCSYVVNLRWGGRNFGRSRFGEVMNNGVHRVESNSGEHVYTLDAAETSGDEEPLDTSSSSALVISNHPKLDPDPSAWMTASQKSLLNHFVISASQITSCHPALQTEYCKTILPMALSTPSLFSAIMALSQTHKEAGIETPSDSKSQLSLVQSFRNISMHNLRQDLSVFDPNSAAASLATILTLCLCEIHAGDYHSKTWRVHFDGARAMLTAINRSSEAKKITNDSTYEFLERWYVSIEALAALTAKGLPKGELKTAGGIEPVVESVEGPNIDDYLGFSTDLIQVFRDIGKAAWERKRMNTASPPLTGSPAVAFEEETEYLEFQIQEMIRRDENGGPDFYPGVKERLSAKEIEDFYLCNRTYQHAALIHLYRRVKEMPRSSVEVQSSVRRILECASQITLAPGLSPWIVLATPLFTAGSEALDGDREIVVTLFQQLYHSLRIRNMQRGLEVLQRHWQVIDDTGSQDWNVSQDDEDMDFIPY